ncbi:hypothetical protein ETB97_011503 [Aspergillus alliaceus]|uniref:Uncharacterized protein n=1 Tax=Petromyces alliaceus TaxID=209559 RepID=A0A8H6A4G5_PETAA|nr:hypothetical protein ETB97_011503 [Aspergillus burnettii]
MFSFQPHLTDTDTDVTGDLFESKFPGLDQREFIALSNLLSLRNDGLAEPVCSLYDDEDGEPENQNDDCLAELAATVKGEGTQRKSEIEWTEMKVEHERVTEASRDFHVKEIHSPFSQNFPVPSVTKRNMLKNVRHALNQLPEDAVYAGWALTVARHAEKNTRIRYDMLPEEEDVCADFGFYYFTSFADKCKLIGLYKGLHLCGIPTKDIHKWQVEALALHMMRPSPIDDAWFDLGYCACLDEREKSFGNLYGKLLVGNKLFEDVGVLHSLNPVQTATFSEFLHAYESRKFDPPSGLRPSVWSPNNSS